MWIETHRDALPRPSCSRFGRRKSDGAPFPRSSEELYRSVPILFKDEDSTWFKCNAQVAGVRFLNSWT